MKSFAQLQEETRAAQLDFLVTDIGAANTFLDVAHTTRDAATRARNVQHATEAYTVVLRMSKRLRMNPVETGDMQKKLESLKVRLDSMEAPGK